MATNDNPFTESNELIAKLLKENNLEVMHLEMYLDTQNVVCVERTTYDAMCYKDTALKAFLECEVIFHSSDCSCREPMETPD